MVKFSVRSLFFIMSLSASLIVATSTVIGGQEIQGEMAAIAGIDPIGGVVRSIGGQDLQVSVLVKPGQDPHIFEPSPSQLLMFEKATLFFAVGLPFERRLVEKLKSSLPRLKIIDLSEGVTFLPLEIAGQHDHDHDHESGSAAAGDPHIWFSPSILEHLARRITDVLSMEFPSLSVQAARNRDDYLSRLAQIVTRIKRQLAPYRGRSFFVFHPAFAYFGHAFDLHEVAVETGGKSPSPRQLALLIEKAKKERVNVIFVQPQFDPKSAQAIARGIDGAIIPLDPLAPDVLENMEEIAKAIEKVFSRTDDKRSTLND